MRTRTYGGVRGGASDDSAYSIGYQKQPNKSMGSCIPTLNDTKSGCNGPENAPGLRSGIGSFALCRRRRVNRTAVFAIFD